MRSPYLMRIESAQADFAPLWQRFQPPDSPLILAKIHYASRFLFSLWRWREETVEPEALRTLSGFFPQETAFLPGRIRVETGMTPAVVYICRVIIGERQAERIAAQEAEARSGFPLR